MLPAAGKLIAATVGLLAISCSVASYCRAADVGQICEVQADFAVGNEDYATAARLHEKIVQMQPQSALAHYHLGFAYGMLGRAPDELNQYLVAVQLGLKDWDLFLKLFEHQNLVEAAEAFKEAALLGRGHAEPHYDLALIYESEGRLKEARGEIEFARRLAPTDAAVANTNAIIAVEMGDFAEAKAIWRYLAEFAPDYGPGRANLAILQRSLSATGQSTTVGSAISK